MQEVLLTILWTWRGRLLAVLGLTSFVAGLILAYKAGQMSLLW